ncbi:MAG: type I-B CRISPR-associated endonuclease Cas1b [Nanoarchaeota archaeon]|nr:type I-B CRISPR-associated endonuclease Cas1b [Nanoarchaeota archaeon]
MKENYYITKDGILKRKQNTVYFINKEINKILPIEKINTIYAYGRITFSSGVVSYLAKHGIPIHFFNRYGFYEGSFYPREQLISGNMIVKQASYYLDKSSRLKLAREFVKGSAENMIRNLEYYNTSGIAFSEEIQKIRQLIEKLEEQGDINQILAIEGNIWSNYYGCYDKIFPENFKFEQRTRRPPENMLNCLISFGNSLLYSTVLTEIYNTQLNPSVSFLHEPSERRFSLALDISEIFKPLIVDRVIFKLINKKMISEEHFEKEMNYCLLNDKGRRLFLENYEEKLKTTIKHRNLGRNVSYQTLIRLECYKLEKQFIGIGDYKAFRIWW